MLKELFETVPLQIKRIHFSIVFLQFFLLLDIVSTHLPNPLIRSLVFIHGGADHAALKNFTSGFNSMAFLRYGIL